MKDLIIRTNNLWYTDDVCRSKKRLELIRQKEGTKQLPPIILGYCLFEYKGIKREYIIIDGNQRAFVDNENSGYSKARLIENDDDLRIILKELDKDHGLVKKKRKKLNKVIEGYKKWLPIQYNKGKLRIY